MYENLYFGHVKIRWAGIQTPFVGGPVWWAASPTNNATKTEFAKFGTPAVEDNKNVAFTKFPG